ncbi:hypothetical protein DAPPUDRAFT_311567 [Daphnia pulex]|uniref:cholesterol 7-desaturase n=1 Tax=Daphnia pulex TaxID=6669 RepID=E9FX99_DAPPU|nr:hypothetical protein DAPPUDRAFT_311567 [Daphnia pulex]|eukprot:EFX88304.1 hypothetical protein DAPPUDRAFT_311567 [Daphnia pulex]
MSANFFTSLNWTVMDKTTLFIQVCYTVAALVLVWLLHYVFIQPLNRIRDLCDTGYQDQARWDRYGRTKRQLANEARRNKKVGDVPPVFPNGWFALCESEDLKAGQVLAVKALDENLAVFRTEEGKVCVLDAYCPHLGAHLGIGGRVVDDCIECPFHGWKFSGHDGKCTSIPYSKGKVPTSAQVKKWPCHEVNGFVFFWYHAETDKSLEPEWTVPELDVISSGRWKYRGRTEYKVNVHIQEIPENGADVAHLAHLHGPSMLGGSDLTSIDKSNCPGKLNGTSAPILHHHWEVGWQGPEHGAADRHIAVTTIKHDLRLFGRIPFILMEVEAKQIGPGLVYLTLDTSLGRCVLVQTVTPIAPFTQRVLHRLYASPTVIAPYAKLILWGEAIQFERDVAVWNHKTYIRHPVIVSEDRTISKHRRWYQQFYSENSPRIETIMENRKGSLDW